MTISRECRRYACPSCAGCDHSCHMPDGQADLFGEPPNPQPPQEGDRRKHEGMQRAEDAALTEWKQDFDSHLTALAERGYRFTADDVVARSGLPSGGIAQNANNAVGAMMNGAARRGLIRKTGRYVKGRRASSHSRMIAEWVGA